VHYSYCLVIPGCKHSFYVQIKPFLLKLCILYFYALKQRRPIYRHTQHNRLYRVFVYAGS
jgi:hypothetical protein